METGHIELVTPHPRYQASYNAYIQALGSEERYPFTLDFPHEDFEHLLSRLESFRQGRDIPPGYVRTDTYWLTQQDEILGVVNFRPQLTESLAHIGGHIGIGIRPEYRGRGLSVMLLKLTLEKAKALEMKEVAVHCYADNLPSNRMIAACGGTLIDAVQADSQTVHRYSVALA